MKRGGLGNNEQSGDVPMKSRGAKPEGEEEQRNF